MAFAEASKLETKKYHFEDMILYLKWEAKKRGWRRSRKIRNYKLHHWMAL